MRYVLVENGEVTKFQLPKSGYLKDGTSVSGYDLLGAEKLKQEGWLPYVDEIPVYDELTHYATLTGYNITAVSVQAVYTVTEKPVVPPAAPSEIDIRVQTLEDESLMALMAIAEVYEDNLSLRAEKEQLQTQLVAAEADNLTSLQAIAELYEMMLPLLG